MRQMTRREALTVAIGAGTAAAVVLCGSEARATPDEAKEAIAKFTGGKKAETGKITIELPEIAENGNTVPLSVTVDSPMEANDYVSEIFVVGEGNPRPGVILAKLTPASGKAKVSTRIRLASTQNIICIAKTSTGKLYTNQKLVKVTIGGCGG
jgi:sulfur-oxidizing protein SoxY